MYTTVSEGKTSEKGQASHRIKKKCVRKNKTAKSEILQNTPQFSLQNSHQISYVVVPFCQMPTKVQQIQLKPSAQYLAVVK